jgi:hypothetical protein
MLFQTEITEENYVASRAQFKVQYKALSVRIRALKLDVKNAMRAGNYAGHYQNKLTAEQLDATGMLAALADAKAALKVLLANEVACAA